MKYQVTINDSTEILTSDEVVDFASDELGVVFDNFYDARNNLEEFGFVVKEIIE